MLGKIDKDFITYDDYCNKIFKRKKSFLILKVIILILIWTPLIVYYFLPISKANIIQINGNALNFDSEYIYQYTELNKNSHIWSINTNNIEKSLYEHPYCNDVEVNLTFSGIKININEIKVIAKSNDSDPTLYLSNGSKKKYSSIKINMSDPKSVEYKFVKPYVDNIPLINETEYKGDDLYSVTNALGRVDNEFISYIKEIKVNPQTSKFKLITLIIDKNKTNLEKDIYINVDVRHIDKLCEMIVIETCIDKVKNNDLKYYNILLENDIENNEIKIVPYNA